jgi:hypothetical protein
MTNAFFRENLRAVALGIGHMFYRKSIADVPRRPLYSNSSNNNNNNTAMLLLLLLLLLLLYCAAEYYSVLHAPATQ